ncbi:MAG: glycosyltransferase [Chloroflexi bacterium]|nr:MAG: glycosyltransferase [Chloroflexota bacterium]
MNILFVVPYVPSLVRVRPYNLIRSLADRGHQVTVFTVWVNEQEQELIEQLRQFVYEVKALPMPAWRSLLNCLPALLSGDPLQTSYSWDANLLSHLNGNTSYDVVHVEHLRGARYGLQLKENTNLPVVWDSVDCISHLFKQAAAKSNDLKSRIRSMFELKRTEKYEGMLLDKFNHILVTSPIDKKALLSLKPDGKHTAPISVIPNGVDTDAFRPDTTIEPDPATIVISGKMSYHANISMVMHLFHDIMPHVWAERDDAQLFIVGKDPTREIQALASHPMVTVTGTVPEIRPYLCQATLAVTPITYGAGIQNKVLEAMACGTPVVTTPRAVSAINIVPERDLLVADTAETFANAIVSLLNDSNYRRQLGDAGRTYIENHHLWTTSAERLENIYESVLLQSGEPQYSNN